MKNSMRRAMISTVCMLIVAVMSLTGVTYAWFTQGTTGQVTGMEMTVTSTAGGVLLSTDKTSWASIINLENAGKNGIAPVSTVGGKATAWTFFTATVSDTAANMIQTSESDDSNYIKQTLYFKNDSANSIKIALGGSTKTTTITENGTTYNGHLASRLGIRLVATEPTAEAESGYVGHKDATVNGTAGFGIFEPNAVFHLGAATTAGTKVAYKGVAGASSEFFDMTGSSNYLEAVSTIDVAENFEIVIPAQSIVQVEVYVWLEGQDSDCTNAVSSSKLKIDLCFEVKK